MAETTEPAARHTRAAEPHQEVVLRLNSISKRFGGLVAVDSVSLAIPRGSIFGLIGPNGAGKTTLFNVISGLHSPTSGQMSLDDVDITNLSPSERAKLGIARTFQTSRLFRGLSIRENVTVAEHFAGCNARGSATLQTGVKRKDTQRRAGELLRLVGLSDHAEGSPESLSYGDQRRLEIARAIASQPKILLLDEPAAGLNPNEVQALLTLIQSVAAEGYTVALVEHNMQLMMSLCDELAVLHHGKMIAGGSPAEITNNSLVREVYLG